VHHPTYLPPLSQALPSCTEERESKQQQQRETRTNFNFFGDMFEFEIIFLKWKKSQNKSMVLVQILKAKDIHKIPCQNESIKRCRKNGEREIIGKQK
jgi:hypothetical protein